MGKNEYLNLKGELLTLAKEYHLIGEEIKTLDNKKSKLKEIIKDKMKSGNIEKARSQLYSVLLSIIQPKPKLSQKKLYEEMVAQGLKPLWDKCLYTPKPYERLTVNLRKGGENIF